MFLHSSAGLSRNPGGATALIAPAKDPACVQIWTYVDEGLGKEYKRNEVGEGRRFHSSITSISFFKLKYS